jgi:predicted phosphodiesterase
MAEAMLYVRPMLALVYDVHGNLRALDAVLADARAAGAARFVLGGDYAAFGPEPAEALAALRELEDATWIRGNWERWCAHPDEAREEAGRLKLGAAVAGAREAAVAALGDATVRELGALPDQVVLDGVRYCHGSPKSDMESFMPEPSESEDELFAGAIERRIVFGHTHLQFRRTTPEGIELVNPGSVGFPLDGDRRAAYALVSDDGAVDLRRLDYDSDGAVAALRKRYDGQAWADEIADRLERAGF